MSKIEELCGLPPNDYIVKEIGNDPNFIFTPDPKFDVRVLFDSESNSVNVNSYIECKHYVEGGWSFEPIRNNELTYQNYIIIFVSLLILFSFLGKKLRKYVNSK